MNNRSTDSSRRATEAVVLAIACLLPTVTTLAYFVWAERSSSGVQQGVYAVAKVLQFALPVVWVGWFCGTRLSWPRWTSRGVASGLAFGVAVAAALAALYIGLAGTELLKEAVAPIRDKIQGLGLATPVRLAAVGVFYSLIHSLLEEYYWRWFVFGRFRGLMSVAMAAAVSSVAFAAHHVVVLWAYFAHAPWAAVLLAGCVAVGGGVWAWLYHKSQSIYAVWLSHLVVDAAIFAVGYHLARPLWLDP